MDGPSGVDDRVPEPHEDPRSPTSPTTSKVVIEWLGVLVPFTTVLTALAFWFGWTLTNARSRYLGVDASVFGFTPTDYILRSADAVIVPVILICLAGLVWVSLLAGVNVLLWAMIAYETVRIYGEARSRLRHGLPIEPPAP